MANANDLRRFAEAADSIRGKDFFVVVKNGQLEVSGSAAREEGASVAVRTDLRGEGGLNGTTKLSVTPGEIPDVADAVFNTQAAFEKFVLPYYVRTRNIDELNAMVERFYKKTVKCAYHDPSSETRPGGGDIFLLHEDGRRELI